MLPCKLVVVPARVLALTVVPPLYVLGPESVSAPVLAFVSPPTPLRMLAYVPFGTE